MHRGLTLMAMFAKHISSIRPPGINVEDEDEDEQATVVCALAGEN
jgi:hypothetical protein